MAAKTFFVAGVTGHVGGAAARRLLAAGYGVRTLARTPAKAANWAGKGVDVREGDFTDAAAMTSALEGVAGAFVMVPPFMAPAPGFPESVAVIASVKQALGAARTPKIVMLSSIGAEKTSRLGLITAAHMLEEELGGFAVATAMVRAGSFYENFSHGLATAETGSLDTFLAPADRKVPMIASEDIGAQVAELLMNEWSGKRIVELGSLVSPDEMAEALGEAVHKPVKARVVPREHWTAALQGMGVPAGRTWAFEEMEDNFNSGWIAFGVAGTEAVAGTMTPREFFAGLAAN